ncbi:MAG: AbrB/MazE/SpoVT family DNA-binding domain-containing protein [archaeon]|nr:AbrB/MazE/SpoVT family DNA-binding domain-containing protein [archaeon]
MYTDTSKFRIRGKYGLFTIPKGILDEQGWKPGDLVGFWVSDGKVIYIQKMCSGEDLEKLRKKGEKYNPKICKKIAKFGGGKKNNRTCGIKSLPEFLMREFKPKDGQMIYFLPAKYTWYREHYPPNVLNNIIFAAFNSDYLKKYDVPKQEDKEKLKKEYKRYFKETFNIPFFNKRLEISEKNSRKSRNRLKRKNELIHDSRFDGLTYLIEKLKKWKKEMQSSKHPQKKDMIQKLNEQIKEVQLEKETLKKDKTPMFKELSNEEIEDSTQKNIEEKRNRVETIKRRNNDKNLSST